MSPRDVARFENLAQTIAFGRQSVRDWCQTNGVSERTGYSWSSSKEFRQRVAELRQAAFDRSMGRMTELLNESVEQLGSLVKTGERKDVVRLQAARGLIADLLAIRSSVDIDRQVAELRAEIAQLRKEWGIAKDEPPTGDQPTT